MSDVNSSTLYISDCRCVWTFDQAGRVVPFPQEERDRLVRNVIEQMAGNGLRTICVAYRVFSYGNSTAPNVEHIDAEPNWDDEANIVNGLTCLGTCIVVYITRLYRVLYSIMLIIQVQCKQISTYVQYLRNTHTD